VGDGNPESVIERFNAYNGRADVPPFWSFGYHQCRWGYADVGQLRAVAGNFSRLDIPLDTLWSDLDYMVDSEVFTLDERRFPPAEMRELLKDLRWVPIIDPGIKNSGAFYEDGLARNAFILDANSGAPFLGKMRAGRTAYPDFFHPNASAYWASLLDALYRKVPFSGLWLDSNEFTSFCEGRCEPPATPARFDYSVDLPYKLSIIPM
jgi:alpha-glucosidase (family GH31 glycosyl hydrolase)